MFTIYGFGYFRASLRGSSFALSATRWPMFWYCCHGSIVTEKWIKSNIKIFFVIGARYALPLLIID